MALKKIINDKPKVGDKSQYNFPEFTDINPNNFTYNDSTGLPENNDKFQNKDLFTNCVGDELNEKIIERNLKFQGDPYIKIDNLYISNTGVDGTTKSNLVRGWIFSQEAYGGDPTKDGYSTVRDKMKDGWKFYSSGEGSKGQGEDIGNITNVEGTPIVSNFDINSSQIILGDFDGKTMDFNDEGGLPAFELNNTELNPSQTSLFNENPYNPIYIVIYMRGHKKVAWPIETDERKRRYDIFKISNEDLFVKTGTGNDITFTGLNYSVNFTGATKSKTGEGGSGARQAAWKVTSLNLQINTTAGVKNNFSGVSNYKKFLSQVLPKSKIDENIFNSVLWLSYLNPATQLDNLEDAGETEALERHPDFIPFTSFGFSQNNQLGNNYVDLQSYNTNPDLIMKASVPLNITFNIDIKKVEEGYPVPDLDIYDDANGFRSFYYFIIDWNDTEEKFKTIDDWSESKPENNFDYLEKQNQNLYKIYSTRDSNVPNNVYTTPGIKNIKYIIFSLYDGDGSGNSSPEFEVGRWKLCTSRIYLDIPPNQYPDFSDVGGGNYTTLPWPFTTPIIGGVSDDSKYKKSIQNTLGGGKVGDFDIIDEKLLVNDLENDEMGKNIETMDLEQIRYFNNGSYNMNTLLGVNPISEEGFRPYNYIVDSPNEIEDILFSNITHNNSQISNRWFGELVSSGNRIGTDSFEMVNYPDLFVKSTIRIKYTATDITDNNWTFFRYMRKDLHNSLKTYEEGGTEYTFAFQIKFNEFTEFAPASYVFRTANRENDYGYSYRQGDFKNSNLHFYRGTDGVYNSDNVKLANYGEWIGITRTRKLISNYSSSRADGYVDGYPNMEFLTSNWDTNFNKKITYHSFEIVDTSQPYIQFVWDGEDGYQVTPTSVPLPFINISERDESYFNLDNSLNRYGWNWQAGYDDQIDPSDEPGESATSWVRPGSETQWDNPAEPILETGLIRGKIYRFIFPTNWSAEELNDYFIDEWSYNTSTSEQTLDFEIGAPIMLPTEIYEQTNYNSLSQDKIYWDGDINKFSEESSVGQIFIGDNSDLDLKQNCKLELNTGELTGKSILDTSGNSNKGLLIGDYKVKKVKKGQSMRRDSFIKVPKKKSNTNGAL